MFQRFFKNKTREFRGFVHILKGKLTGNEEERLRGATEALNALEEEREIYLSEKHAAEMKVKPDLGSYDNRVPQDKIIRESNNRDISGY